MSSDEKLQRLHVYMTLFKISKTTLSQRMGASLSDVEKYLRGTLPMDVDIWNNLIRGLGTMICSDIERFILFNYVNTDLEKEYLCLKERSS